MIVFIFLLIIGGGGIYYYTKTKDQPDQSLKINYRNVTLINPFLIIKHYKSNPFCSNMTIYGMNDTNETELYRISWNQLISMTLTRIKDGFIVSRAQQDHQSSYSFELFGPPVTNGTINYNKTNDESFTISYIDDKHKMLHLWMSSLKEFFEPVWRYFIPFRWSVAWIDPTPYDVSNDRHESIFEMVDLSQGGRLIEKSRSDYYDHSSGLKSYRYVYELQVPTYLPVEFYLTTLIIGDHATSVNCKEDYII